jgi:hypothetical protein
MTWDVRRGEGAGSSQACLRSGHGNYDGGGLLAKGPKHQLLFLRLDNPKRVIKMVAWHYKQFRSFDVGVMLLGALNALRNSSSAASGKASMMLRTFLHSCRSKMWSHCMLVQSCVD